MKPEEARIAEFLDRYSPAVAADLRAARAHLAQHFPRGFELVYDNYNALVFGFGPSERASDAVVSVAGYPRWATLFFLQGAKLPDPARLLSGTGSQVRSVRLQPSGQLLRPEVQALIAAAKAAMGDEFATAPPLRTVIKSVSSKQRARRATS